VIFGPSRINAEHSNVPMHWLGSSIVTVKIVLTIGWV
jgi:hypothetical protein